jgi:hypothetical protein
MRLAMGGIVGSYLLGCLVWLVLGALPPVEHLVLPLLGASRVLAASGERRAASGERRRQPCLHRSSYGDNLPRGTDGFRSNGEADRINVPCGAR